MAAAVIEMSAQLVLEVGSWLAFSNLAPLEKLWTSYPITFLFDLVNRDRKKQRRAASQAAESLSALLAVPVFIYVYASRTVLYLIFND